MGSSPVDTSPAKVPTETKDEPAADERGLPRGFFKMEAIKGRHDPSVHERRLPDIAARSSS